MEFYRKGSHSTYDLKYHLVWITKYRRQVLDGPIAERLRYLIREICRASEVEIVKGHIGKDHVHLFVSMPPHVSVSRVMQMIRGKTSRKLLMEYEVLRKKYWGQHMWARGYFAASSGNVTDEVIMRYIENQDLHAGKDEDFKIGN